MEATLTFRRATSKDYTVVCALLSDNNLPIADLKKELGHFFVAEADNKVVGSIGLEEYGNNGLLRSMAVEQQYRNGGIASKLVNDLLSYSKERGLNEIYLITITAYKYFARKGFDAVERKYVPEAILDSSEFSQLCPSTATVMKKKI